MKRALHILSVGQCGMDAGAIASLFTDRFAAKVDHADSAADATRKFATGSYSLVLVNRVFDADGFSGLKLIESLLSTKPATAAPGSSQPKCPIMLISDRADAQAAAVAIGAVRGFGKSSLRSPATAAAITAVLH